MWRGLPVSLSFKISIQHVSSTTSPTTPWRYTVKIIIIVIASDWLAAFWLRSLAFIVCHTFYSPRFPVLRFPFLRFQHPRSTLYSVYDTQKITIIHLCWWWRTINMQRTAKIGNNAGSSTVQIQQLTVEVIDWLIAAILSACRVGAK